MSDTSLCLASRLKQRSHESSGFYLGYLRGRSIPPMLSLQHISNYIGKIIQTRRGQCTWSKYSLSTQSCLKMHWMHQIASRRIFISKNFRHPPRSSWHSATRDFSPKRQILDGTLIRVFLKSHTFLHESVFRPHETSESRHRERIFLKPLSMQSGLRPRPQEAG